MEYSDVIKAVADAYDDRAMALLNQIADACRSEGLTVRNGPFQMFDNSYQWSLTVRRTPPWHDDDPVDVTLEIAEERDYGNPAGSGINFGLSVAEYDGTELGGRQPHNFTPLVWVDARDPAAVAARWDEFTDADFTQIPAWITEGCEWEKDGWYKQEQETAGNE
jgi:hypothetical protein